MIEIVAIAALAFFSSQGGCAHFAFTALLPVNWSELCHRWPHTTHPLKERGLALPARGKMRTQPPGWPRLLTSRCQQQKHRWSPALPSAPCHHRKPQGLSSARELRHGQFVFNYIHRVSGANVIPPGIPYQKQLIQPCSSVQWWIDESFSESRPMHSVQFEARSISSAPKDSCGVPWMISISPAIVR